MKEALVAPGPKVQIVDSPIPEPGPDQVVTKVVVSGTNPKDYKLPDWLKTTANEGDDIAGIVHSVGSNVTEFKPGDRVAAFHEMMKPHGSYAEYALSWQHTTFHIPKQVSFEEAATLPLAVMTSCIGLYLRLGLPEPWRPATTPIPLVIYGAASAVGSYAVQLAVRSNIHPLICIAGKSQAHVESMIDRSKGDTIVEYRSGNDGVVAGIKNALNGQKLLHAFDAVSEKGSYQNICRVLEPTGKITLVLVDRDFPEIPASVEQSTTMVGCVHEEDKDFGQVFFRYIAKALGDGWFRPQPHEVVPGGLDGVQTALDNLKEGKANAVKYVFRISETKGL
ncbi:GroES-like protein [Saccharata proteae CBS 121410]|uniref:GroES-like protein n=1 Tax=Saccharata proteae CBS 121410 TaxID=1314787 RepID=A0A9P4I1J4_9PEZI|nr:GroES-like protein [Saccharata proteae CBS 121410]